MCWLFSDLVKKITMEKIKNFNLELSLFVKELNFYIQNVNEIDNTTIKLLSQTIVAINKLQINSRFCETSTSTNCNFADNLNDEIFKCRRIIVCCLCHEQISLNDLHIQKNSHKEKVANVFLPNNHLHNGPPISSIENGTNHTVVGQIVDQKTTFSSPESKTKNESKIVDQVLQQLSSNTAKEMTSNGFKTASKSGCTLSLNSVSSFKNGDSSLSSLQCLRDAVASIEFLNGNNISANTSTNRSNVASPSPNARQQIETHNVTNHKSGDQKNPSAIKVDVNEQIFQSISDGRIALTTRTANRIANENEIFALLTRHLKEFNSQLEVMTFGSTTYGFGGLNTNLNILVNTGSSKSAIRTFCAFVAFIKKPGKQNEFKVLASINGDRVQKRRIPMVHKESGIKCYLQFGFNFQLAESSQILRDCVLYSPMCYHLIAYVKSWQNALNDAAPVAEVGRSAFHFNSYIISVLVIFFLQNKRNFPKLIDLPRHHNKCVDHVFSVDNETLNETARQFFEFYGKEYKMESHLISINIGQWVDWPLFSQQTTLTTEQKRLKEGIELCASNWKNCTMYVEDIVSPGINITAEVSKQAANQFKEMCNKFTPKMS